MNSMKAIREEEMILEEYGFCRLYLYPADENIVKYLTEHDMSMETWEDGSEVKVSELLKDYTACVAVISAGYDTFVSEVSVCNENGKQIANLKSRDRYDVQFNQKLLGDYVEAAETAFNNNIHYPTLNLPGAKPVYLNGSGVMVLIRLGGDTSGSKESVMPNSRYVGCANGMVMQSSYIGEKFSCKLISAEAAAADIVKETMDSGVAPKVYDSGENKSFEYVPILTSHYERFFEENENPGYLKVAEFTVPKTMLLPYAELLKYKSKEMSYSGEDFASAVNILKRDVVVSATVVEADDSAELIGIQVFEKDGTYQGFIDCGSAYEIPQLMQELQPMGEDVIATAKSLSEERYPEVQTPDGKSYLLDKNHSLSISFSEEEAAEFRLDSDGHANYDEAELIRYTVEYFGNAEGGIAQMVTSEKSFYPDVVELSLSEAEQQIERYLQESDALLSYCSNKPIENEKKPVEYEME